MVSITILICKSCTVSSTSKPGKNRKPDHHPPKIKSLITTTTSAYFLCKQLTSCTVSKQLSRKEIIVCWRCISMIKGQAVKNLPIVVNTGLELSVEELQPLLLRNSAERSCQFVRLQGTAQLFKVPTIFLSQQRNQQKLKFPTLLKVFPQQHHIY